MTTTATTTATTAPARFESTVPSEPVSLRGAIRSEWVKLRTLRSSWLLIAVAAVGLVVLALVIAYNLRHLPANPDPEDTFASSALQGYHLDELLLGALGVLFTSAEYATGTIRTTLVAVPRRLPVLVAKLVVMVPVVLVVMVPASLIGFLGSQAVLGRYRDSASLGDPGVLRAVLLTGVYLAAVTAIGNAIGWIVRSTPGALVTYLGLLLVAPVILGNLLGSAGASVNKYLPSEAGFSMVSSGRLPQTLTPGVASLVLLAWVALTVVVGAVVLRRRDA